jgi:hypothetical protein
VRCAFTTIGRKSGQERSVIIGYVEDGPNLVALAMNGWDEGHPSWWLNLEHDLPPHGEVSQAHRPTARGPHAGAGAGAGARRPSDRT